MIVKSFWILLTYGLPVDQDSQLLSYSSFKSDNEYRFHYSTNDQSREEYASTVLRKEGDRAEEYLEIRGSYSFFAEDGRLYTVDYVAGINGYQANMTILEIPEEPPKVAYISPTVLKSLVG
ncbi:hypothetical protein DMENIID0001_046030 [Sergentomyia squamirostris]